MKRWHIVAVVALLGLAPTPLPCSTNCALAKGQSFSVAYDWAPTTLAPDLADGFRLSQDGVIVQTLPASALAHGVIAFPFVNGLSKPTTYTFVVTAYNADGESPSDPIVLTVLKGKPAAAVNGRFQ